MSPLELQILSASTGWAERGPYVRLVGRQANGHSAAVTMRGIFPHLYVKLEHGLLRKNGAPNEALLEYLRNDLNDHLNRRVRAEHKHSVDAKGLTGAGRVAYALVKSVECVRAFDFYGYSPDKHHYAKLTFASVGAHTEARYALSAVAGSPKREPPLSHDLMTKLFPGQRLRIDALYAARGGPVGRAGLALVLAEANIDLHDQVMDELGIKPGGWCALDLDKLKTCHHNTQCAVTNEFEAHPGLYAPLCEAIKPTEVARAAPVRVLAWDLEVWCVPLGDGAMRFFDGDDPGAKLLCVSAVTFEYGVPDSTKSVVFSLGEAPAPSTIETATDGEQLEVRWFGEDERGLLKEFFGYVRSSDADVVTGWNTLSFDWPWLVKRTQALHMTNELHSMARWGTVKFDESDKARQIVEIPGRELHDMMLWVKKNRQLREYNLQFVATEYGLDGKDSVTYDQIAGLFTTHEGRVKLAVYCALDSRLVCQLMQLPQLDPLGKTLAIAAITGVQPEHVLHRGSMHTLRLAMLRASHKSDFVLSCPSRGSEGKEALMDQAEDESRYQGGKARCMFPSRLMVLTRAQVLNPISGFYREPCVTLDFGSLYPSCMCELNICASTRLTRAAAKSLGLEYTQPPAPDLTGTWYRGSDKVARIHETADDNISIYSFAQKTTKVAWYTDQLNETITLPGGAVWVLEDGGYKMRVGPDEVWCRADKDVLVCVQTAVREGVIPMLERTLKLDRKAAKKKLAQAEAAGDKATETFMDNLQSGIKILMNALYGGLGSGKGGIFPESAPLASAITARGRSLIVMVKKTLEARFWLLPDGTMGGFNGEPVAEGGKLLRVLYGDTDSVMIHFPACTLQQAADHGQQLSTFFDTQMLKPPQSLCFEKKKMYASYKYQDDYSPGAKGKLFARGLSAVRRDNAKLVQDTVLKVMDMLFKQMAPRSEIVAFCGAEFARVHNSAVLVHAGPEHDFEGRLPFEAFVQSAGISKALCEYDAENSATAVARQMLAANPQCGIGKNARVTFILSAQTKGAKRSQQALLPSTCLETRAPLDTSFYTGALLKKLAPLISVLFMEDERASRRVRTLDGSVVMQEPASAAARARLLGEAFAERAILEAFRKEKLVEAKPELRQAGGGAARGVAKRKAPEGGQKSIADFFKH